MPGTREGSIKTRNRNLEKTGMFIKGVWTEIEKGTYYQHLGAAGGKESTGGGFAAMDKDKHIEASRKGGSKSRRTKADYDRAL